MPLMKVKVLFPLLTLALLGSTAAELQDSNVPSRVLYDSRLPVTEPRLTESERNRVRDLVGQAAKNNAWSRLEYTGADYTQLCSGDDFTVLDVASGSFTTMNTRQIAYLYTYCWSSHADVLQGLAIFQGNKAVAHYLFHDHYSTVRTLKDLNLNGRDELLLRGSFMGQGYTEGWVNIAEVGHDVRFLGQLDFKHLPQPYSDNCGAVEKGTWESIVIRGVAGSPPSMTQQQLKGRCSNMNVATFAGPVRPLPLQTILVDWLTGPLK